MAFFAQAKTIVNSPAWILFWFAFPLGAMGIFAIQQALKGGVQVSDRVRRAGGSLFLNPWIMEYGYWWLSVPVRLLIRYEVSPNAITLGGFAVVLSGCAFCGAGFFGLAGPLLLVGSLADMLDGIVARERGLCSDAGEFVDSIVDRYADVALFAGLCVYYVGHPLALLVVLAGLLGSVMVSYARAKAESLGIHDAPGGPMRRAERAVYLGFSIFLAPLLAHLMEPPRAQPMYYLVLLMCGIIGVLANIHAVQMTLFVDRALRKKAFPRVRCALLGFGAIAERAHLPALQAAGIEVALVVEPSDARRALAASLCPNALLHRELNAGIDAAAAAGIDFVLVCTPPDLHAPSITAALQGGLHVLCEKPLVRSLAEAQALAQLAEQKQRVLGCVNNWTAAPIVRAAWSLASRHDLGPLRRLEQHTWRCQAAGSAGGWRTDPHRAGGGILLDHGWHGLSIMLRSFAGAQPQSLRAELSQRGEPLAPASRADDTVSLWMDLGEGRQATYHATWLADSRRNTLRFEHRAGSVLLEDAELSVQTADGQVLRRETYQPPLCAGGYRPDWMAVLLQEFIDEVRQPQKRGALLAESLAVQACIERAYASAGS